MSDFQESVWGTLREWPYPVNYGKENEISVDVLVLGGGIAGCHAAINAARGGAKVAVVDKGAVIRSGLGGSGVDHWHNALTNPCSGITPEEFMSIIDKYGDYSLFEFGNGITCYIMCKESWDALLDMEKWGMKIRDVDDEFVGAEFRDEETKLMFAYDYDTRHCIRIMGEGGKPAMYNELKRLGVSIFDRVMATSLLTEGGKQGSKVIGATGINTRTGEFYIFKSKATLLSAGVPGQMWVPSSSGLSFLDLNNSGESTAMAWQAGAELTTLERSSPAMPGSLSYPGMGTGMPSLTWYACSIVDDNGKQIPWVDRDGRLLKTVSERYHPSPGQRLFNQISGAPYEIQSPNLIPDVQERIMKGEYVLPFYADLPGMPEHERRVIFGLMVGHEGRTRPLYERYTRDGFDPDKDMLQVYGRIGGPPPGGGGQSRLREAGMTTGGGLVVDWDLKTSLEGLYAAGTSIPGSTDYSGAAASGRYAGRKMAAYVKQAAEPVIDRNQIDAEKTRIYTPVRRPNGIGWKELHAGICQIMQEYCGENKSEKMLNMGLNWLDDIKETEAAETYARNPHELSRTVECFSRITVGKAIMHASLARKASSRELSFNRIDFPEMDPPEWNKFVTIRQQDGEVKVGELPLKYWIKSPNDATYEENYKKHCGL